MVSWFGAKTIGAVRLRDKPETSTNVRTDESGRHRWASSKTAKIRTGCPGFAGRDGGRGEFVRPGLTPGSLPAARPGIGPDHVRQSADTDRESEKGRLGEKLNRKSATGRTVGPECSQ